MGVGGEETDVFQPMALEERGERREEGREMEGGGGRKGERGGRGEGSGERKRKRGLN